MVDDKLWKQYGGKSPVLDNLMTVMGFNPNKDYSQKKRKCPKCGKESLVTKERHPDTDISYMADYCRECGYEKEL